MLLTENLLGPRVLHPSGKEWRPYDLGAIPPSQSSCPFPERLEVPFPSEEILSGCEDIFSSGTDQRTTWVKTDPDATLVQHMVDVQKAIA